jgi:hypothetical protein
VATKGISFVPMSNVLQKSNTPTPILEQENLPGPVYSGSATSFSSAKLDLGHFKINNGLFFLRPTGENRILTHDSR